MTRSFNEKIRCERCGHEHTVETDFERWMRRNSDLDSRHGLVRFDLDILLHRYKCLIDGKDTRDIQCMMFVEVKTFMAVPSTAQIDTLSMLNQVMRNRRPNMYRKPRSQVAAQPTKVTSKLLKKDVTIRMFGGHLLQLDGTSPENSKMILWDYKPVTHVELTELLMFDRDPDDPARKLDHRRRSEAWSKMPMLPFMERS